ncbi:MAG: DMT family transporter [Oscillospiraceae bacterium]|nr:DMT family transporter [Oscillospiraceae bacterium]
MKREYLLAGGAVIVWGTGPAVMKTLVASMPAMEVLFLDMLTAAAFLAAFAVGTGKRRLARLYTPKVYLKMAGMGFLGIFVYSALYCWGIKILPVQDACVINYLWPILIVLFSCIVLGEKLTARKAAAIAVSFLGVVLIAAKDGTGGGASSGEMIAGALMCVAAAVSYALFAVLNKKEDKEQTIANAVYFAVAALCSGILMALGGNVIPLTAWQIFGIVWSGVVVNGVGYLLWSKALNGGDTAKISTLAYCVPALTMIISIAWLHEAASLLSAAGLAMIIIGVFIQMSKNKQKTAER